LIWPSGLLGHQAFGRRAGSGHGWRRSSAFPLPGGNLTSIHRLETDRIQGLTLTTLPACEDPGDDGVWFANPWLPLRLPINDRIRLWPDDTGVKALHEMWLFGIRFLTLDYRIVRAQDEPRTPRDD
jgi:hypothetical protein